MVLGFRYDYFVDQVRKNLHVVVSMDPTNAKFLLRCESNPALYTRCALLWMGSWGKTSMEALPAMLPGVDELVRGEMPGDNDGDDDKGSGGGHGGEGKGERKGEKKGEKKGERKGGGGGATSGGGGRGAAKDCLLGLVMTVHGSVPGATPLE
jgi:dynein heavy chain 2